MRNRKLFLLDPCGHKTSLKMAICVGDQFDSYDSLKRKIKEIERSSNCLFVTECSNTVENANKLLKDGQKLYDPRFKYRYMKLGCKHAGSVRTTAKGEGKPGPNQS